jgi:hypothetical protein
VGTDSEWAMKKSIQPKMTIPKAIALSGTTLRLLCVCVCVCKGMCVCIDMYLEAENCHPTRKCKWKDDFQAVLQQKKREEERLSEMRSREGRGREEQG